MQSQTDSTTGLERFSASELADSKKSADDSSMGGPKGPLHVRWWVNAFPFFSSALFFLSTFCAVIAPFPLILLNLRKGRKWAWIAAVTNGAVVGALGGSLSLAVFFVFVLASALTLPEFLNRKKSIEVSALGALIVMAVGAALCFLAWALIGQVNPLQEIQGQINVFMDYVAQSVSVNSPVLSPADIDERRQLIIAELPSAIAIFALIMVWSNLVLVLRINPEGIREKLGLDANFFKKWKVSEYLVWPAILTGAFLVFQVPVVSDVALNCFNFIMAIYVLQGLSIMSFIMDRFGIRGVFRVLSYAFAVGLVMPMVLSLGFFDQWFDFRSKLRQS